LWRMIALFGSISNSCRAALREIKMMFSSVWRQLSHMQYITWSCPHYPFAYIRSQFGKFWHRGCPRHKSIKDLYLIIILLRDWSVL
jgi:hypothetical protein